MKINIVDLVEDTIVDGPGLRVSIYLAGCTLNCPGCHNKKYQDKSSGHLVEISSIIEELKSCKFIDGVSILGGEPFQQPVQLLELLKQIKTELPSLNIWVYTGYIVEKLKAFSKLFDYIDCVVDGPFKEALKCDTPFIGSSNQRILTSKQVKELL